MARGRGIGRGRGRKMPIMNDVSLTEACVEALGIQEHVPAEREETSSEAEVARSTTVVRKLSLDSLGTDEEVFENSDLKGFENESKVDGNRTEQKTNELWVKMFKNNCVASNGMQLTYFPPQVVNGQTMVQFEEKEKISDMNEILFSGPYTINNLPIILKQWCPEFDLGSEFLTEIPLWVNFPKLCGIFEISYARMLVEVNVTKVIPQKITVVDPNGKTFMQDVELEWRPQYCDRC
ncbi:hypothetical protein EJD97_009515 [Solanum chilense]|uniref:Uncharacterized protein n=1 Tax=Solanum chilense TaxID=4083 RepID=A0A6N2AGT2_SOLCI|nr:hypothetical protein EJD97_009515 [Solanum chilense]